MSIFSRTWSYDQNSFLAATWAAVEYIWWFFCYASLLHIAMNSCIAAIKSRGINMSHCLHQGWGARPVLRTIMVSSNCHCIKCSRSLVHLAALPGQTSTGQLMDVAIYGKTTRYSFGIRIFNGCGSFLVCPYRP